MIYSYFICIAWGIMYYLSSRLTKNGLSYPGFSLILLPITMIIIVYGYLHSDYRNDLRLLNRDNSLLVILFVISSFLGNFLVFLSMKEVDPFTISMLEFGYPIVIFTIMFFMGEIVPNWKHFIGIIFTFIGIYLVLSET